VHFDKAVDKANLDHRIADGSIAIDDGAARKIHR
jgi:hypothetical protein